MGELEHASQFHILMVEDFAQLRALWTDLLRGWGFRVTAVASADQALEVLESDATVHVLFSDIRIPGRISGLELARWVKQHRPAIGVILQTGSEMRLPADFRVLLKPVDQYKLRLHLQEILSKSYPVK